MGKEILMKLSGSKLLTNSWKQDLVITSEGVEGEVLRNLKRIKMSLPYDRIAQVNLVRSIITADLEIVNKGGSDNLTIKGLKKSQAEEAKKLIESKIQEAMRRQQSPTRGGASIADEIKKFAELRDSGILTEEEFQAKKRDLLGM